MGITIRAFTAVALVVLLLVFAIGRAEPDMTNVGQSRPTEPSVSQNLSSAAPPREVLPGETLDLETLKEQLKETRAIGMFTKLALKGKIDDLLDDFREHHQGKSGSTLTELRRSYELLVMKVLSLLQDEDPQLAAAIVSSREAIWNLLADPKTFETDQG